MKILMVLTSHDTLGNTGQKTGLWLEEFAAPYFAFLDAGVDVTVASPKDGKPPIDPKSNDPDNQGPAHARQPTKVAPFLAEDELKRLGGLFEKKPDWEVHSIVDGLLVTGQNPASSTEAALALLNAMK